MPLNPRRRGQLAAVVTATSVILAGCKDYSRAPDPEKKADLKEAAENVAEEKEAKEKRDLVNDPARFLEVVDWTYRDDGIINSYRQMATVRVINKSKYAVRDVAGEVDWLDAQDQKLASMPFSLKGSIPAGDTKQFALSDRTLTNGTVKLAAKKGRVRFLSLRLVEP